jgi:hypothetical protein
VKIINVKQGYVLAFCSILFFVIYSYLAFISPDKFVSPDEVANYHFTQLYAQTGELKYSEDLNYIARGIIHPRGAVFTDGYVTSAKFLGFQVVNGTLAVIIPDIIRFLTPLLAVIGALFFYLLIRDMFNSEVALFSYLLLLLLPTYFYWSSLSMFENIAGCVMIIISFRYFFLILKSSKISYFILFGLFFGLSLFIRPDFIFLAIPFGIIALWKIKKIKKTYLTYAFLALLVSFGPFLILNNMLYGSPLTTGQHVQYNITQTFLGDEFSMGNLFTNTLNLINLMPVIFICTLLGVILWIKSNGIKSPYIAFSVTGLLALSLYYLDDKIITTTVHSSYGRYLLPASILFLPFLSYFIYKFRSKIIPVLLVLFLTIFNILTVTSTIESNLYSVKSYAEISQNVAKATESNAVVFLDYWDKAIYPERRVAIVSELPEENLPKNFSYISIEIYNRGIPVYLYYKVELSEIVAKNTMDELYLKRGFQLKETDVQDLYRLTEIEL